MKADSPCFFMLCTNGTEGECLKKGLFGDREWRLPYLKTVKKGDLGFLLNVSQDILLGIFEAEGPAKLDIDKDAWAGGFPAQIKVKLVGDLQRIRGASGNLGKFLDLKTIQRHPHSYKIPAQNTYGPEITEKALSLFKSPKELKEIGKREEEIGILPETTFTDVAGLQEIKEFVYQRIIAPFEDEEATFLLKLRIGGGMLLYGPPGTGKTLIAMSIAANIQAKFMEISPSVIVGYPGVAEKRLENMFAALEKEPRAVVFLDEAEWILCKRGEQTSSVMQRITPVLLAQLSRIFKQRTKPIVVIAATNKPDMIDTAFLRPGRFDKVFYVRLPDEKARVEILKSKLKDRSSRISDNEFAQIAADLEGYSGADIEHILEEAAFLAFSRKREGQDFHIKARDISKAKASTPKSVTEADIQKLEQWAKQIGRST